MFCSQCGKKLVDNAKFCSYCGAKVELPETDDSFQNKSHGIGKQQEKDCSDHIKNNFKKSHAVSNKSFVDHQNQSKDEPFLMPIEDVFTITGRGTVVTGRVERGVLHVNDEVEIVGLTWENKKTVVIGIEMFRKLLDEAYAGDNISIRFN